MEKDYFLLEDKIDEIKSKFLIKNGWLKIYEKAASFVTIGKPDVQINKKANQATVEIRGLDIYWF